MNYKLTQIKKQRTKMGKPFSECTLRELKAKAKTLKTILAVFCVIVACLIGWIVYRMVIGENVLVGAMLPAIIAIFCGMLPSFSGLAQIKKEVEKRLSK